MAAKNYTRFGSLMNAVALIFGLHCSSSETSPNAQPTGGSGGDVSYDCSKDRWSNCDDGVWGGSSGTGGAGGSEFIPSSSPSKCGEDEVVIADMPELLGADGHSFFVRSMVSDNDTVYIAFFDTSDSPVGRIYALPRCGGAPPKLLIETLDIVSPRALGAGPAGVFAAVNGSVLRLTRDDFTVVTNSISNAVSLFVKDDLIYVLADQQVLRVSSQGETSTVGSLPSEAFGALIVDDTNAYFTDLHGLYQMSLTDGTVTVLSPDVTPWELTQDSTRIFALDYHANVTALDKTTGDQVTITVDGNPQGLFVDGNSLFVGLNAAGAREISLETLQPTRSWSEMSTVVYADQQHLFGALARTVWRAKR